MERIDIHYSFRPTRRSLHTGEVADLFGIRPEETGHTVADNLVLDVRPGDVVVFTGPSGSGKSSLLREAGRQLAACDVMGPMLFEKALIDSLTGELPERLEMLAACGLAEGRLMLRTPGELSDGQRYRFRMALGLDRVLHRRGGTLLADEFAANLDRTLAKVLAYNLRKLATRMNVGMLLATTHEDLAADLRPDLHVHCRGHGQIRQIRDDTAREPRPISFASELRYAEGIRTDWQHFFQWHYRSHQLPFVRRVVLLMHGDQPIGICVFACPAASLTLRSRYFGLRAPRTRLALAALNEQLWLLARVVLHPTYRGAGIAAQFVRHACATCPVPWIETLTAMGHANPFFERAGFTRVGVIRKRNGRRADADRAAGPYASDVRLSTETIEKSRYSEPVYYVLDNRARCPVPAAFEPRGEKSS